MLVLAKVVGVAGLVVGVTSYRVVGGVLLGLDAVLLLAAFALCVGAMRGQRREEKDQKELLAQMLREGTLDQLLADVRAETARAAPSPCPASSTRLVAADVG